MIYELWYFGDFWYILEVILERGNFNVVYMLNNKILGVMWIVICEFVGFLCGV